MQANKMAERLHMSLLTRAFWSRPCSQCGLHDYRTYAAYVSPRMNAHQPLVTRLCTVYSDTLTALKLLRISQKAKLRLPNSNPEAQQVGHHDPDSTTAISIVIARSTLKLSDASAQQSEIALLQAFMKSSNSPAIPHILSNRHASIPQLRRLVRIDIAIPTGL